MISTCSMMGGSSLEPKVEIDDFFIKIWSLTNFGQFFQNKYLFMLLRHFLFQHNKKTLIEPEANNKQIL
jgi:hypothetical protein